MKHQQYKNWFAVSPIQEPDSAQQRTRAPLPKQLKCKPVPARTGRYYDSPIPYLSRLPDLEKTGILGSWILRNICQNHQIEEHLEQSAMKLDLDAVN